MSRTLQTSVEAVASAPVIEPAEHGLTDASFSRAVVVGSLVGCVVITVLMFLLTLAAGVDVLWALGTAPVPGVVAGVFFGGNAFLGRAMAKADRTN